MKFTAIVAAVSLTLAGAAAMAQSSSDTAMSQGTTQATTDSQVHHTRLGDKIRNGAHRVGAATRNAGHHIADAARRITHPHRYSEARHDDTQSMGATGTDSARQARMDDAYAKYQKKQQR